MGLMTRIGESMGIRGFGGGNQRLSGRGAVEAAVSPSSSSSGGGKIPIVLTGVQEIDAYLAALPENIEKKALRSATRDVAKYTRELALFYAPEDTGALKSAIKVKAKARQRGKGFRHVVGTSVVVGEGMFRGDTFYGGFLEFGTNERQHKSGHRTGRIAASLFDYLRRALWSYPSIKREIYISALEDWVAKQQGAAAK